LVGELHAGLEPPEEIGHQREIAVARQIVGDVAHHLIDAEDLLDDDDARAASRSGCRQIAGERAPGAADRYLFCAHPTPLYCGRVPGGRPCGSCSTWLKVTGLVIGAATTPRWQI